MGEETMAQSVDDIIRDTHCPRKLGSAYKSKVNQFKTWVDTNPQHATVVDDCYLTRENVDKYFLLELRYRSQIQPQNLRQMRNALKQYAEYEFPPGGPSFTVDSDAVHISCEEHQRRYQHGRLNKPECAHANLMSDVLSEVDKLRLVLAGSLRLNWSDYCLAQTSMTQTAFRGISLRISRLADLWHDLIHGPGPTWPMLGMIEQDNTGKVMSSKKKVRGMWRHRLWELCGSGWLAASVVFKFSHDPKHIGMSFSQLNEEEVPEWYSLEVVDWSDYTSMYNAFTALYKALNISWAKATHFRRQAIDDAQSNKADAANVSCQTGHGVTGNMEKFYAIDSPPDVLHALAGFSKEEPYFCERWLVDINDKDFPLVEGRLDMTNNDLADLLIPNYRQYLCDYQQSPVKWDSTKNFLKKTLPFLCYLFVTDNPYRSLRLAGHPLTVFFNSVFGQRGVEWGHRQIQAANQKMSAERRERIAGAERSNQEMFMAIQEQQRTFEQRMMDQQRCLFEEQRHSRIEQRQTQEQLAHFLSLPLPPFKIKYGSSPPKMKPLKVVIEVKTLVAASPMARRQRDNLERYAPAIVLPLPTTTESPALPIPSIASKMPRNAVAVLEDHFRLQLEKYRNVTKERDVWREYGMRYSRRLKAFLFIESKAKNIRNMQDRASALMEAAKRIDVEKGNQSFVQYIQENETTTKRPGGTQKGIPRQRTKINNFF